MAEANRGQFRRGARRPANAGRKLGSPKQKIPGQHKLPKRARISLRAVVAALEAEVPEAAKDVVGVIEHITTKRPQLVEAAYLRGLAADPPHSFRYVELALAYGAGKPALRVEVGTPQPIVIGMPPEEEAGT